MPASLSISSVNWTGSSRRTFLSCIMLAATVVGFVCLCLASPASAMACIADGSQGTRDAGVRRRSAAFGLVSPVEVCCSSPGDYTLGLLLSWSLNGFGWSLTWLPEIPSRADPTIAASQSSFSGTGTPSAYQGLCHCRTVLRTGLLHGAPLSTEMGPSWKRCHVCMP